MLILNLIGWLVPELLLSNVVVRLKIDEGNVLIVIQIIGCVYNLQ